MAQRVAAVQNAGLPFIVATDVLGIVGYAYAAPFHDRAAYLHTLTASVYVARGEQGRGVGRSLYSEVMRRLAALESSPHAPVRSVVALIALPNDASVALHEALGFRQVGTVAQAGRKFDRWIDVGYWQLLLAASTA
jgi:phosphinothricin acetyltransferase